MRRDSRIVPRRSPPEDELLCISCTPAFSKPQIQIPAYQNAALGSSSRPPLLRPVAVQRPNNPDNIESDHRGNSFASEENEIGDARLEIAQAITKVRTDIGDMRAREAELISVLQQYGSANDHYAASGELERVIRPGIRRCEVTSVNWNRSWTGRTR